MKQYLIAILIITIISGKLFSQSDFRPGFIINNSNDTINGLIDYKGDIGSARICVFKKDATSDEIKYSPEDIRAYRFTNSKYYVSKNPDLPELNKTVFLEFLIDGIVDVYYYRDLNGENYYLIDKGNGKLLLLKDTEKEVLVDGKKYISGKKEYIGVLKYVFEQSPSVSREVENITLDRKSLISVSRKYHAEVCTDKECIIYEKKLPLFRVMAGPQAGLNMNTIHINSGGGEDDVYLDKAKYNAAVFPSLGIFVKASMPSLNERLYLQYDASIGKRSFVRSSTHKGILDTANIVTISESFSQFTLNNSFTIRYEIPKDHFKPSFHAGLFMDYYFQNDYKYQFIVNKIEYDVADKMIYPYNKSDFGINLGAGIMGKIRKNKSITLNLEYQYGIGISNNSSSNNLLLRIGLQISR